MHTSKPNTDAAPSEDGERFLALDALRGLSALAVVVHHLPFIFHHPTWLSDRGPTRFGVFGVQMFFVISGFVISMSLRRAASVGHFLLHRAVRLYPLYAVSVLVATVSVYFLAGGGQAWLWTGAANLLFVQRLLGIANHVDAVYWTLQIEAVFYLGMAALLWLARSPEQLTRWLLGAVWLHTVAASLANLLALPIPRPVRMLLLLDYGFLFWIGALLFAIRTRSAAPRASYAALTLVLATLPLTAVPRYYTPFVDMPFTYVTCCVLVVAVFAGAVFLPSVSRLLAHDALVFLGTCSYALYLGHFQFGHSVYGYLEAHLPAEWAAPFTLLVIFTLAVGLTLLWDEPVRRSLRRLVNARFKRRTTA